MKYIGRFAPSPSGPLHFGSLVAALGSWLDARANNGQWLVRVEDLDPPREMAGAIDLILKSLEAHRLYWDGEILYQSQRLDAYEAVIASLKKQRKIYPCTCTRKIIRANGGLHQRCHVPDSTLDSETEVAWRLLVDNNSNHFEDIFHGPQTLDIEQSNEDYVLKRKDNLHAYMLAVVVDDIHQDITHVIRGSDLAHTSCQQRYLFETLNSVPPGFGHLPMALHPNGDKLSKQTHARALNDKDAYNNILSALSFLNQDLPKEDDYHTISDLLTWATNHWQPGKFLELTSKVTEQKQFL